MDLTIVVTLLLVAGILVAAFIVLIKVVEPRAPLLGKWLIVRLGVLTALCLFVYCLKVTGVIQSGPYISGAHQC
jgi:hypothetical protein